MTKKIFIYAFDPKIKRRCVFVVFEDGTAYSLLTGYKIKIDLRKIRNE